MVNPFLDIANYNTRANRLLLIDTNRLVSETASDTRAQRSFEGGHAHMHIV